MSEQFYNFRLGPMRFRIFRKERGADWRARVFCSVRHRWLNVLDAHDRNPRTAYSKKAMQEHLRYAFGWMTEKVKP